jgi:hypothetical protein
MNKYASGYTLIQILSVIGWLIIVVSIFGGIFIASNAVRGMGWVGISVAIGGSFQGLLLLGIGAIGTAILDGSIALQNLLSNQISRETAQFPKRVASSDNYLDRGPSKVKTDEKSLENFDVKRWNILKEVDSEIFAAVNEVKAIDSSLEAELAERYMSLQDKAYLKDIVDTLIKSKSEEIRIREGRVKEIVGRSSEKTLKEIDDFEKSLGSNGFNTTYDGTVVSVEPYEGSWRGWSGGIIVKFSDGRVLIKKGSMVRLFKSDDNSWQ